MEEPVQAVRKPPASGLVLLALLIMLMLVGVGALAAAELWSTTLKREREEQLLFVGSQYRRAIESYWKVSPGRRAYPPTMDVLLTDDRFPTPMHHLRRLYRDPMTDTGEFEPIMQANALVGVHSTSTDTPIKHANFPVYYKAFEDADSYVKWQFIFVPKGTNLLLPGSQQPTPAPASPSFIPQGPAPGVPVPLPPASN
jgi:type II secretory pathway pseudopilin PulG